MRRNTVALAVGFVHNGAKFIEGECWNCIENIVMDPAATIGIDLDPISAMRKLFTHCLTHALDAIDGLHTNRYSDIPGVSRLQRIRTGYVHGTPHHLHS